MRTTHGAAKCGMVGGRCTRSHRRCAATAPLQCSSAQNGPSSSALVAIMPSNSPLRKASSILRRCHAHPSHERSLLMHRRCSLTLALVAAGQQKAPVGPNGAGGWGSSPSGNDLLFEVPRTVRADALAQVRRQQLTRALQRELGGSTDLVANESTARHAEQGKPRPAATVSDRTAQSTRPRSPIAQATALRGCDKGKAAGQPIVPMRCDGAKVPSWLALTNMSTCNRHSALELMQAAATPRVAHALWHALMLCLTAVSKRCTASAIADLRVRLVPGGARGEAVCLSCGLSCGGFHLRKRRPSAPPPPVAMRSRVRPACGCAVHVQRSAAADTHGVRLGPARRAVLGHQHGILCSANSRTKEGQSQ